MREYLGTPGLNLRLVNLPGYSPDFNADEAIWGWAREEATGNLCLGTREAVQERVGGFLAGLTNRPNEVRRRCRTVLQSRAESLQRGSRPDTRHPANAHPTLALVYYNNDAFRVVAPSCLHGGRSGVFRGSGGPLVA